ncbi:ATP-binding protein [Methylophilus sp.]|uniref:ATP-binding protein n=1 Tax=Methylophilus sp. TaxID=29541 RepID=UPI004037A738
MTIAINRLLLRADTADGPYGVDIPFSKGLFILRVENTHGKSTCINSIAYALGMEMALGQVTSKPPFPPSLLKNIQNENGTEIPVISSYVMLEISNDRGQIYTHKTVILGADSESIITVYESTLESIY